MKTLLFNTAHPLSESGKPIFIPFGEWDYDGTCRQRLDRAHGERIANELNARVARGEPGIPVYQGHPDVPQLASRYPDKGALGWVSKIELVNEGGRDGLALTVEWDRDPGRGFKWFSPYWIANERDGNCHIVAEIASVGLVNNPNIPEFRLANELQGGVNDNETGAIAGEGEKKMDRAKLIQALGLPETATDEDIFAAIEANKAAAADAAAKQQAAEADKAKANEDLAGAEKERDEAKTELENCKKQLDETKTALANEKAQHEKTRELKTQSVTTGLANEKASGDRMALVNELQRKERMSFDEAWAEAKKRKPELFK